MEDDGPSLPSNYVTILQLKERWLQQQSAKSNPRSSVEPKDDSASKIPNEPIRRRINSQRDINQLKPDVSVHDSGSKIANETVPRGRNLHRVVNQLKPEVTVLDSASKTIVQAADDHPMVEKQDRDTDQSNSKVSRKKKSSRSRNPRFVTDQIPTGDSTPLTEPQPEPAQQKKQHHYVRKLEHDSDQSKPKLSSKKNSARGRNPRSVTDQIPTGGSTLLLESKPKPEPETVQEKKQHHRIDGCQNRNRNRNQVGEPKVKTPPRAQDVDDVSHNGSGVCGVVEAVAAASKEMNVSQRTYRGGGSVGFPRGPQKGHAKPPFGVKKGQTTTTTTTTVWVKKGESAPN